MMRFGIKRYGMGIKMGLGSIGECIMKCEVRYEGDILVLRSELLYCIVDDLLIFFFC